jgi:hypothetical protein
VHHPDAGRERVARILEAHHPAVDGDLALVRLLDAASSLPSVLLPAPFSPHSA